jgi:hypothetical protein
MADFNPAGIILGRPSLGLLARRSIIPVEPVDAIIYFTYRLPGFAIVSRVLQGGPITVISKCTPYMRYECGFACPCEIKTGAVNP